ncbi:MAG: FUSC family membrane protein [Clostridia bacterium]|nr:FUSC family membrane protein [Clostridia bacterium]
MKSVSFSRAIRVGIAVTLPVVMGIQLGYFEIGLALSFGAFWSSPSDVTGSFRHIKAGILISATLVMLVSFSGLMALVLSFASDSEELKIYQYAVLLGVGGLWYLLLSMVWHRISPKAETEEFLSETYVLTAEFIEARGKLIDPNENHDELQSKIQNLQSKLTENHKTLREILILSRRTSYWSNYQDKRLLIFVQLVEMLETTKKYA